MPDHPALLWDTSKPQGWFSIYEAEKAALHRDSWDIAVSPFSLSAAPSWISGIQTLREKYVCLHFKNRLIAGYEYPATVAQLCLCETEQFPKADKSKREIKVLLAHQFRIWYVVGFCFFCKIFCTWYIFKGQISITKSTLSRKPKLSLLEYHCPLPLIPCEVNNYAALAALGFAWTLNEKLLLGITTSDVLFAICQTSNLGLIQNRKSVNS